MLLHHQKHHQAYVNNLNVTEEKLADAKHKNDVGSMIALQPSLTFNGGGIPYHVIFINLTMTMNAMMILCRRR